MDAAIESYAAKLGSGVSIGSSVKAGDEQSKYSSGGFTSLGLGTSKRVGSWDPDLRGLPRLVLVPFLPVLI